MEAVSSSPPCKFRMNLRPAFKLKNQVLSCLKIFFSLYVRSALSLNAVCSSRLCCGCGIGITPNPSNMCVACLRTQVDITKDIPKQVVIYFCRFCERSAKRALFMGHFEKNRELPVLRFRNACNYIFLHNNRATRRNVGAGVLLCLL